MTSLARKMQRSKRRDDNARGQQIINNTPLTRDELLYSARRKPPVMPQLSMPPIDVDRGYEGPVKPDKGLKGGSCNRTACQDPGATWFNHSTRAYYCGPCARLINAACRRDEFVLNLGHDLCMPELPEGRHPTGEEGAAC